MIDDIPAQVENRQGEEALLDEEQAIEHPARAAVAVGEGVDGLKLIVGGGHPHERIELIGIVLAVEKTLPIREQPTEAVLPFRGRVDHLPRAGARQRRARRFSNPERVILDPAADQLGRGRAERTLEQVGKPLQERMAIPEGFLGGRIRRRLPLQALKQPVGRGDDVLDLRTGLSLEERERIDEDGGIGELGRSLLELSQRRPGGDTPLQNRLRLQLHAWREQRQAVVGPVGTPPRSVRRVAVISFLRHIARIGRRRRHVYKTCRHGAFSATFAPFSLAKRLRSPFKSSRRPARG